MITQLLNARSMRLLAMLAVLATLLAACGGRGGDEPDSTPSATNTPIVSLATRTPEPAPTPAPGELSVGQIADGIAAAWPSVASMRVTSQSTSIVPVASPVASPAAAPVASPVAQPPGRSSVEEVVFPGSRHVTEYVDGVAGAELVLVNGVVTLRGVPGLNVADSTPIAFDPAVWTTLDPATLPADGPLRSLYDSLSRVPQAPYSGLSQDQRDRIARPIGDVTVNGQSCAAYRIADTTLTGERVDIVISLRADGLPCSIETRSAGNINLATYEFNIDLVIAPPS